MPICGPGSNAGDLSRWPTGIYARAYIRAYAVEIGADPDVTVDAFCRLFPHGDRRAERVVRGQAELMGHDLRWKDDLVGSITDEKRATPAAVTDLPPVAFTHTGRIVATAFDVAGVAAMAVAIHALLPIRLSVAIASAAVAYHAGSMLTLWPVRWLSGRSRPTWRAGTRRQAAPVDSGFHACCLAPKPRGSPKGRLPPRGLPPSLHAGAAATIERRPARRTRRGLAFGRGSARRLDKVDCLAALLKRTPSEEIESAAAFLSGAPRQGKDRSRRRGARGHPGDHASQQSHAGTRRD